VNNHFERSRVKNNGIYFTGRKITLRDREIESSSVNLLSYIGKKIGSGISLREIEVRVISSHLYYFKILNCEWLCVIFLLLSTNLHNILELLSSTELSYFVYCFFYVIRNFPFLYLLLLGAKCFTNISGNYMHWQCITWKFYCNVNYEAGNMHATTLRNILDHSE
jgi:hypothetical protein